MNILLATHYWLPHPGGIEYEALEQARRLARRGHKITVVTSAIGTDPPYSAQDGIELHRVPINNFLERKLGVPYPLFSPALFGKMNALAKQNDVIVAHSHTFMSSVAAAFAARRARKPFVAIQNNPHIQYPFPLNAVYAGADAVLGRYTLGSAARLLAISKHTGAYAQTLAPRKQVEVVYPGVDTHKFTPVTQAEKSAIRQRLGLPVDGFIALTVRRLFYRNGVDILIKACPALRDLPDVRVVVGGKGPDRPMMDKFISENALTNVPVIATRSGAPEEIVEHGVTGLLVPPDAPAALAGAIRQMSADRATTRRMGLAARAFAETLDWERSIDQLEAILNSEC
jgi:glycosyltransferase involved in cell wall biosynthesis